MEYFQRSKSDPARACDLTDQKTVEIVKRVESWLEEGQKLLGGDFLSLRVTADCLFGKHPKDDEYGNQMLTHIHWHLMCGENRAESTVETIM